MILALNVGNTNIVLGVFQEENLVFQSRISTDKNKQVDEYSIIIKNIISLFQIDFTQIKGAIISSVVPALTNVLIHAVEKVTLVSPLLVGPGIKTGLNIKIENPSQLGSDIVANAVAANKLYPAPIIIFDMGTATTISVIDEGGMIIGILIAPGIRTSLDALSQKASQLPEINIEKPKDLLGINTLDSMKSGVIYGGASLVDGLIDRLEKRIGKPANVVATGGLSSSIIPFCTHNIIENPNLLLTGLYLLYKKNT